MERMKTNYIRIMSALVLTWLMTVSAWAADTVKPTISDRTITVTDVSCTSISVKWNKATDNITPQENLKYSVGYKKSDESGYTFSTKEANATSKTIDYLEFGTEYDIIVRVFDGTDNYSDYNVVHTTTKADVEAPIVPNKNVTALHIDLSSVKLEFVPATDNATLDLYIEYRFSYKKHSETNYIVYEQCDRKKSNCIEIFQNLEPGITYDFLVQAMDQAGNITDYNVLTVTTEPLSDAPILSDKTITVRNITAHSVDLSWTKAKDDVTPQEELFYSVEYKESNTTWFRSIIGLCYIYNQYNTTANELKPNTWYDFRVTVKDKSNNITEYDIVTIKTLPEDLEFDKEGPTLSNKTLTISNTTSNSVTLKWTKATDNLSDQKYIRYIVEHKASSDATYGRDATLMDIDTYTVTNLTEGHDYVFRVRAVDEAGNYTFFDVIRTKATSTQDLTSPTKTNSTITVSDVTYSSFKLSWTKATDNVTPQADLQYYIYVKETGEIEYPGYFDKGYDISSCVVTGLEPSTQYTFMVRVVDKGQNSSYYIESTATTKAKPVTVEKYDVYVMYDQVTSKNADDILNDGGSLKYDATTNTLIMNNCNFEYDGEDAITLYSDVTIRLIGDNSLKGRIFADTSRKITFTGTGTLTAEGDIPYLGYGDLSIEGGCTVAFYGVNSNGISFDGDDTLYVIGSTLRARGSAPYASIYGCADLEMTDCDFGSDHRYEYGNYCFLDPWGDIAVDEIVISSKKMIRPEIEYDQITIDEITNNSAMATWNAATDDDTPQSDLVYRVFIRKSDGNGFDNYTNTKGVTSCCFTGLEPETSYDVFIKVVDSDGKEAFYRTTSFTTAKTPDVTAPTLSDSEITVSDATVNSVTISWTKATDDRTSGEDLWYSILYNEADKVATEGYITLAGDLNISEYTITDLNPSTEYSFNVNVYDNDANRSEYTPVTATTAQAPDETAPTVSDGVIRVDNTTETSIAISWTAATDDRSAQDKLAYTVSCKDVATNVTTRYEVGNETSFVITALNPETEYAVSISVKDEAGNEAQYNEVKATTLQVPDETKPTLPDDATVTAKDITPTSFTVLWNAASDNRTADDKLKYSVDIYNEAADNIASYDVESGLSYTFTELTPETKYTVTVFVKDEAGNWEQYPEVKVTTSITPDETKPTLPADASVTVTETTTSSVSVKWNAASDNRTDADKLKYKVTWATGGSIISNAELTGETTYTITGLTPETEYEISVAVTDEAGNKADYTSATVATQQVPDETKPTLPSDATVTAKDVTPTSFSVSWNAASDDRTAQDKLKYSVDIYNEAADDIASYDVESGLSYTFTELTPETKYRVTVFVKDEAGNWNQYPDVNVTTPQAPDTTAPEMSDNGIRVMWTTDNTIGLEWTAATDDRTAQDKLTYTVSCKNVATADVISFDITVTSFIFTALAPETEYEISVSVKDEAGNISNYTPVRATTQQAPDTTAPVIANAIITAETTENSITISWTAATDDRTAAEYLTYSMEYKKDSESEWQKVELGNGTSYTITGLDAATGYDINVTVTDEAGNTANYNGLNVTTAEIPDGIDAILAEFPDAKIYNLAGHRVSKAYKGVVIINGKKYLAK